MKVYVLIRENWSDGTDWEIIRVCQTQKKAKEIAESKLRKRDRRVWKIAKHLGKPTGMIYMEITSKRQDFSIYEEELVYG